MSRMRALINGIALLFMFAFTQGIANATAPRDSGIVVKDHWLMMVTTENTDPARESEFNDWYNNVDIPDVLQVPGYARARRGREQGISESATADSQQTPHKYVALYDIRSHDIDKTIIDMLMASWSMEKSHHSTDLLKVTERVYFHQYGPTSVTPTRKPTKANRYLYLARFDCCHDAAAEKKFNDWYGNTYVRTVLTEEGIVNVTRYKLYRVLMEKPLKIPNFMSVFEIDADSAAQAMQSMQKVREKLSGADRASKSIVEGSPSIFLEIKDVRRP